MDNMLGKLRPVLSLLCIMVSVILFSGCATTEKTSPGDPYEATNRKIYNFNDALDRNVLAPVARSYVDVTPKPVRSSITNFFSNVGYLNTINNSYVGWSFTPRVNIILNPKSEFLNPKQT